ncbi:MIF4G domain-containing protein A-like [Lingula anatina]|uniref:MIF4G domain-containing protein A-like n=1 Tax=Lingula anatina TaxID=7574 RepID=A0A1S3IE61_LINAN|nr:MIF4G domain-containing protein A-like [Lingula anatina]XP_013396444.1 MIF4G domain-containing protein A-like [Lingula anatina]XP_013396445.1 MIF4G domain-containing protein A-like [Lingula anatina]XP_013396446.1 MIF4G domain-containing protein A-like [Lingula anatina]XP_013396447.1 MIF4G domain-containing protein A-like [Lingula anatina]XP_013396448.1 MIF4G domain-containing protein A-like [Lingula anatina]XP_023930762.1 MIF4G domain-containing protein A-like [Lingula anatina]|eukprot:XP_013396443.1 MIF4G domain-containing protein A-like [Lingula anatina]
MPIVMDSTSPGLNMAHGFVRHIQQCQMERKLYEQSLSDRKLQEQNAAQQQQNEFGKSALKRSATENKQKQRPDLPLYQPPGLRFRLNSTSSTSTCCTSDLHIMNEEVSSEEVDLPRYIEEMQGNIAKALKNPKSVTGIVLDEVAHAIVNRAYEDTGYYKTAAKMCKIITQKETELEKYDVIPCSRFRYAVIDHCQRLYDDHVQMRETNRRFWMEYVHFLAELYHQIRDSCGRGIRGIFDVLYKALMVLSRPPCIFEPDEMDVLCSILHEVGQDLEVDDGDQMDTLICGVRDAALEPHTEPWCRGTLMQILELRASRWELPHHVAQFYYENSAD